MLLDAGVRVPFAVLGVADAAVIPIDEVSIELLSLELTAFTSGLNQRRQCERAGDEDLAIVILGENRPQMPLELSAPRGTGHLEANGLTEILDAGSIGVALDEQIRRGAEVRGRCRSQWPRDRQWANHRGQQYGGLWIVGRLADTLEEYAGQRLDGLLGRAEREFQTACQLIEACRLTRGRERLECLLAGG